MSVINSLLQNLLLILQLFPERMPAACISRRRFLTELRLNVLFYTPLSTNYRLVNVAYERRSVGPFDVILRNQNLQRTVEGQKISQGRIAGHCSRGFCRGKLPSNVCFGSKLASVPGHIFEVSLKSAELVLFVRQKGLFGKVGGYCVKMPG